MNIKYYLNEIRKNYKNKFWIKKRIIYYSLGTYYRLKKNKGIFVIEEDWDNLIILDACRFDTFKEVTGMDTEFKISRGSGTPEFLKENFQNYKFKDTIYVTANPYVNRLCKNSFFKIISVWKNGWNDEFNTVLPEVVTEYALRAEKRYPDKRLIIHFVQPHWPYIRDQELHKLSSERNLFAGLEKGNIKLDLCRIYEAYKRNLEAVLPHAFRLAHKLTGKSVITADHGEAFNEWAKPFPIKVNDHHDRVHISSLVKVPWMVFNKRERKKIRDDNNSDEKRDIRLQARNIKYSLKDK